MKVYLGGRMSGLTLEEMSAWRKKATALFNARVDDVITHNPCKYYNFELDPDSFTQKECKEFDLWLVKNCDIVLVNLDNPDSIGTAIEMECASRFWGKPIIAFGTDKNHPWIIETITKYSVTLEDAVDHIMDFYYRNI